MVMDYNPAFPFFPEPYSVSTVWYHSLGVIAQSSEIDRNVFYYSYSTIAQTLAGAFGFLAAVVLYRLQALNGQLHDIASHLIGDPRTFNIEPFRTLYAYHRWHLFVDQIKRDQDSSNRNPVFKNLNFLDLGAMDHASDQVRLIRRWFVISMLMTLGGISLCLSGLFLMAWWQSLVFLLCMLVLGLLCMASYVRLMVIVLQ
jgi:hypothetical protein